jgi:hypothetical protein
LAFHGEDAAKGYAIGEVGPRPLNPTEEMQRVWIDEARRLPKPGGDERKGNGPRNPEQKAPLSDKDSGVTLPAGLPVTKLQPILVDSELLMQWREQCRESEARAAAAASEEPKTKKEESRTIAPVVTNAPRAERRGRAVAIRAGLGAVAIAVIVPIVVVGVWRNAAPGGEARRAAPAVTETPQASAAVATSEAADAGAAAVADAVAGTAAAASAAARGGVSPVGAASARRPPAAVRSAVPALKGVRENQLKPPAAEPIGVRPPAKPSEGANYD